MDLVGFGWGVQFIGGLWIGSEVGREIGGLRGMIWWGLDWG